MPDLIYPFTKYQRRVLRLLARGDTRREIARKLGLTVRSVDWSIDSMLRLTDTTSTATLLARLGRWEWHDEYAFLRPGVTCPMCLALTHELVCVETADGRTHDLCEDCRFRLWDARRDAAARETQATTNDNLKRQTTTSKTEARTTSKTEV